MAGWLDLEKMRALRSGLGNAATPTAALLTFYGVAARPAGARGVRLFVPWGNGGGWRMVAMAGQIPAANERAELTHLLRFRAGDATASHRSVLVADLADGPAYCALLVPLVVGAQNIAVLSVHWDHAPEPSATFWMEATAPLMAARLADLSASATRPSRVLVVEDDPQIARLLDFALAAQGYSVTYAATVAEAREQAARFEPDLVVVDMLLPDGHGSEVVRALRRAAGPSFLYLSAMNMLDVPFQDVDGYIQKPFSPRDLVQVVADLLDGRRVAPRPSDGSVDLLERYAVELALASVEERAARAALEDAYLRTVEPLAAAREARDPTTGAHLRRVRIIGCALADAFAPDLLDDRSLEYGFLLHDVGKIAVPDAVLRKPGRLTMAERDLMRSHVAVGEQLVERVPYLAGASKIIGCHHERWDGAGYPRGLRGEDIPLGARIFAVAD